MSPEAFLLTWGHLGAELALVRLAATAFLGIAAGFVALKLFPPHQGTARWVKISLSNEKGKCDCEAAPDLPNSQVKRPFQLTDFFHDLKKISIILGGWLAVAFVLEAVITFYVPSRFVENIFGVNNALSVVWAAIIGIPLYVINVPQTSCIECRARSLRLRLDEIDSHDYVVTVN